MFPTYSTEEVLEHLAPRTMRPTTVEGLLYEPVLDAGDPGILPHLQEVGATTSYDDWKTDHQAAPRFHILGLRRFTDLLGLNQADFAGFKVSPVGKNTELRRKVIDFINDNTDWPSEEIDWSDELGRPQCNRAFQTKPLSLDKAIYLMADAELIVAFALENQAALPLPGEVKNSEWIYSQIALLPACYNVDDFGEHTLNALKTEDANALGSLRDAARQREQYVISDMVAGMTVTRRTASMVKAFIDQNYRSVRVGEVRARPGQRLGQLRASENETIVLD